MKLYMEKILEIHKNGINAHNSKVSYYLVDYRTKETMFDDIETLEKAKDLARRLGYKKSEILIMF